MEKENKKPRLDKRVRDGLRLLASVAEAGGAAEFLGSDEEVLVMDGRTDD